MSVVLRNLCRGRLWCGCVLTTVWFGVQCAVASGAVTAPRESCSEADERLVDTFVLTPIVMRTTGYPIPAERLGPITNNSCRAWESKRKSCYLPVEVRRQHVPQAYPWMHEILERHLSAWLDAWRVGAWPPDGASLVFGLERYHSIEHLWLCMSIDLVDKVNGCWLTGGADPEALLNAATRPASRIELEAFGSTRGAQGYPQRKGF
jgi:hypothetical protein